ncbi:hypothetical protein BR63_11790 [Thermanaerosceptrum fracticalcis]|uniref:Uncharacterized protein n=1 Tax=Thermanaerosceptrum fracticalcis TaxID=1712410 RepID=A0A7G6E4C7_THEFR|nr:hypothetical protein [Thermanaerosceptrum fracticalcis]QNB46931.1 hypothetical protein BR63_11790 [Thermanaerosceptrum fracticalcis]
MQETNCCARCGQPLNLIDEAWAEDKVATWRNLGEYCPSCYLDLVERQREHLY